MNHKRRYQSVKYKFVPDPQTTERVAPTNDGREFRAKQNGENSEGKTMDFSFFRRAADQAERITGGPQQLIFQALVRQYALLPPAPGSGPADARLHQSVATLIKEAEQRRLTWLELYDFESMLMRLRDDASLRRAAWSVRTEFKRLATTDLWNDYQASKPPNLADSPINEVRTDVEDVLCTIHELRVGQSLLHVIRVYTTSLALGTCSALIWMILFKAPAHCSGTISTNPPTLLLVATAGVFGAAFSTLSRIGQIPSKGDLVARYPETARRLVWILTPMLALMEGTLGAIVLYFIFRAGLLSGVLFPEFPTKNTMTSLASIVAPVATVLPTAAAVAKLFIWCFVAGFSERLVPDLLTRLTEQAQKTAITPTAGTKL